MTEEIKVFDSPEFGQIRTVQIDGEPWFVGKDVAAALGYKDTTNALKQHVDDEDKKGWQITTPSRGTQNAVVINESGLYSLILGSKLESAKRFKRWVTSEVLPAIRKDGGYIKADGLSDEEIMARAVLIGQKTIEQQAAEIARLKPAAEYANRVLYAEGAVTTTQIAKDYGMSGLQLNSLLKGMGIQFKVNGQWVLKARYVGKGYTASRSIEVTHKDGRKTIQMQTVWTQKGRAFIDKKLRTMGFVSTAKPRANAQEGEKA